MAADSGTSSAEFSAAAAIPAAAIPAAASAEHSAVSWADPGAAASETCSAASSAAARSNTLDRFALRRSRSGSPQCSVQSTVEDRNILSDKANATNSSAPTKALTPTQPPPAYARPARAPATDEPA